MGWKFWQSKNNTDMEKVTEGDSRIDEHIAQELSGLKFQPDAGGKSTTSLKGEGKNGKNTSNCQETKNDDLAWYRT